jgi:uncharacterized protein YggE
MMKNKVVDAFFAIVAAVGLTTAAAAGTVNNGAVVAIRVDASGKGLVQFDTGVTGVAGCATANASSLAFDTNTAGGKAVLTLVTTAKLSGKKVQATGSSTCTVYPNAEDFNSGTLQN